MLSIRFQVDVFSFGMWLYEMTTGLRPLHNHNSVPEIKRDINGGVRPSLVQDRINLQLPYLQRLMIRCWQQVLDFDEH